MLKTTSEISSIAYNALKLNLPDLNVVLEYSAANSICYGLYEKFSSTKRVGQVVLRDNLENNIVFLDSNGNQIFYNIVLNIFSKTSTNLGQYKFFKNKSENLGIAIKTLYSKNSESLKTNFEAISDSTIVEKAKNAKYTGKVEGFRGEFKDGYYFDPSKNIIFGTSYDPKIVDFYLAFCSKHKDVNIMTDITTSAKDINTKAFVMFTPHTKSIIFNTPEYTLLYFTDVKECYLLPAYQTTLNFQKIYGVDLPFKDLSIETNLIDIVDKLQNFEEKESIGKVVDEEVKQALDKVVKENEEKENSLEKEQEEIKMTSSINPGRIYGPTYHIDSGSIINNLTVPNFTEVFGIQSGSLSYYPNYSFNITDRTGVISGAYIKVPLQQQLATGTSILSPYGHTTSTVTINPPLFVMNPQDFEEALVRNLEKEKKETPLTFKDVAKKDAKSAAYRVAAKKTMKLLSVKLAEIIAVQMKLKGKQKGSFQERFSEFLLSDSGSSMFSLIIGTLMPQIKQHIPKHLEQHVDRFAEECRVNGLAYIEETVLDTITSSFSKFDVSFFDNLGEKVRVVDDKETKNNLTEELEDESVSGNNSSLATL
jgi:hypothetical protein